MNESIVVTTTTTALTLSNSYRDILSFSNCSTNRFEIPRVPFSVFSEFSSVLFGCEILYHVVG